MQLPIIFFVFQLYLQILDLCRQRADFFGQLFDLLIFFVKLHYQGLYISLQIANCLISLLQPPLQIDDRIPQVHH